MSPLLVANPVAVVRSTSATWGQVSRTRTPIQTRLQVYNPHPFPVVVTEVGYRIRMNNVRVGRGTTEESVVIVPHETETVTARTSIRTETLDEWWVTHLERNQVTTVRVDFALRIDPAAGGGPAVRVPLETMTTTVETDVFGNNSSPATETNSSPEPVLHRRSDVATSQLRGLPKGTTVRTA